MLNVTNRNGAYESAFHSASELYPRKNRFLASTGFSNLNSSMQTPRLPQLSRSFSSSKSAKLKLTTIEASLSVIGQQLHELRHDTRVLHWWYSNLEDIVIFWKMTWERISWGCWIYSWWVKRISYRRHLSYQRNTTRTVVRRLLRIVMLWGPAAPSWNRCVHCCNPKWTIYRTLWATILGRKSTRFDWTAFMMIA